MAINLWKLGGQPTSYNPMSASPNYVYVRIPIGKFVMKFKAKSPSGGRIEFTNQGQTDFDFISQPLLSEYQTFIYDITSKRMDNIIYLYNSDNKTDLEIIDIELVRKPLGNPKRIFPKKRLSTSKTGLAMDGISNYLQLPSMTMDSVEIECLIDSSNNTSPMIVDARTGSTNQLWLGGTSGFTQLLADGVDKALNPLNIPKGQRTKVKVIGSSFTDNITIFANNNGFGSYLKGILYKVTCYLNGSIVAQYDFENPKNIVGNQVLQNAQNLIPSFEDTRWSIHQNAKVMGKDVLHLDATGASQSTKIDNFKVLPNTKYFLTYGGISSGAEMVYAEFNSIGGVVVTNTTIQGSRTITTSATTDYIYILLRNVTTTGSFDFIRPQLYQLSGKEGTINGSPIQQNKARKRTLYAKR